MEDIERAPVLAFAPVVPPLVEEDSSDSMSWDARGWADVSMSNREEPLARFTSGAGSAGGEVASVGVSAAFGVGDAGFEAGFGDLGGFDEGGVAKKRMDEGCASVTLV